MILQMAMYENELQNVANNNHVWIMHQKCLKPIVDTLKLIRFTLFAMAHSLSECKEEIFLLKLSTNIVWRIYDTATFVTNQKKNFYTKY